MLSTLVPIFVRMSIVELQYILDSRETVSYTHLLVADGQRGQVAGEAVFGNAVDLVLRPHRPVGRAGLPPAERFEAEGELFGWWKAGPSYWAVWSQDQMCIRDRSSASI